MTRPDDVHDVMEQLASLAPGAEDAPQPVHVALAQVRRQIDTQRQPLVPRWRFFPMLKRKGVLAAFAALLILVVAFSLPPVRAAASDFLGLFRVQKFAAISVSPRQLALLEELGNGELYPGTLEMMQEPGPPQSVASLDEAMAVTGQAVFMPQALAAPQAIQVSQGGQGRLVVDVSAARRIMAAAGADPLLVPASLDGQVIDVTVFPSVEMRWTNGMTLIQTQSPVIDYPEEVDPRQIGQALLELLGMSTEEARRLAANIDWTNTLLLPVPENLATFSEVRVNGDSGLALASVEGEESSLMWQEGGTVFVLFGTEEMRALQDVAESVR